MTVEGGISPLEGDVPGMRAAASYYKTVGTTLSDHAQTISSTTYKLASWTGPAAQAHGTYSDHVVGRYNEAADTAHTVAHKVSSWADQLEADQHQVKKLSTAADGTAKDINKATTKLAANQKTLASAKKELASAEAALQSFADQPLEGGAVAAASQRAAAAKTAVTTAQAAVTSDQKTLKHLHGELTSYLEQATKVKSEAQRIAAQHNTYMSNVQITPPAPLPPAASPTPVAAPAVTSAVATSAAGAVSGGSVTVPPVVSGPIPDRIKAMIKQADAMIGLPYVWGGGHAGWGPQAGYDCSGFVSKVLHAAGFLDAPQTTQGLPGQHGIANGPGHYVTIYDRTDAGNSNDHVIIDINGQFYESGGEAGAWGGGGGVAKIGTPSAAYLSSFNQVLHPVGF